MPRTNMQPLVARASPFSSEFSLNIVSLPAIWAAPAMMTHISLNADGSPASPADAVAITAYVSEYVTEHEACLKGEWARVLASDAAALETLATFRAAPSGIQQSMFTHLLFAGRMLSDAAVPATDVPAPSTPATASSAAAPVAPGAPKRPRRRPDWK